MPRSLFGRLVLVLLPVLVVAQFIGFALHMHERGEALSQASGLQSAQRIAGMVRVLDSLDAAQRRDIAQVLGSPALSVSLERPALAEPQVQQSARAALFAAMLRRFLGDGRPVAVSVSEAEPSEPAPMRSGRGRGMHDGWAPPMAAAHYLGQTGLAFVAQVRLRDGALATFDSRLPGQTA
ncbi:MAG TPA: two-component sensor histidine kinase, partial [Burkholderiales bacterium]|nr:two-component sensor histidine kinase [Burkholderiales bacterium]